MDNAKLLKIIDWLTNGNSGASSKCLLRHMLGMTDADKDGFICFSHDFWDRERCVILLEIVPEWWKRIDEMAKLNDGWKREVVLLKTSHQTKGKV